MIVVVPIGVLLLFARLIRERKADTAMLLISSLLGVFAFGNFNPLQSAWPIFNRGETSVSRMLDELAAATPQGTLAIAGFEGGYLGATLNGWGYRSIAHVLVTPRLDIWREKFHTMPADELNQIFNRYAHIILRMEEKPILLGADAIGIPLKVFTSAAPGFVQPVC
jgi:hypothetical protein